MEQTKKGGSKAQPVRGVLLPGHTLTWPPLGLGQKGRGQKRHQTLCWPEANSQANDVTKAKSMVSH